MEASQTDSTIRALNSLLGVTYGTEPQPLLCRWDRDPFVRTAIAQREDLRFERAGNYLFGQANWENAD